MGQAVTVGAAVRAVIFDFYGTLGESTWTGHWLDDLFRERGYELRGYAADEWDGKEHDEHSQSRDHYAAWMRSRWLGLLAQSGVPAAEHDAFVAAIDARREEWEMRLYPEALDVLHVLRDRGCRVVLCSNWDWDLDAHVRKLGIDDLFDGVVCSAWLGARKPHRRMFEAAVAASAVPPAEALFVGDNVVADVEGALAAGIPAVHVWRGDDHAAPPLPPGARRVRDLRELLPLSRRNRSR